MVKNPSIKSQRVKARRVKFDNLLKVTELIEEFVRVTDIDELPKNQKCCGIRLPCNL